MIFSDILLLFLYDEMVLVCVLEVMWSQYEDIY